MMGKFVLFIALLFCAVTAHAAETCPAGQYLNGDTCTVCPSGTYKDTSGPEECTPCPPADATTVRTTYPDTYYPYDPETGTYIRVTDPILRTFTHTSWATGIKTESECEAFYEYTNDVGTFRVQRIHYSQTTGRYDSVDGLVGYYNANPGYYLDTRFNDAYCNNNSYSMMYQKAIVCPAGYYCPGGHVPNCASGPYETEWGRTECPAGSYCPAGASAPTACPAGTYSNVTGATDAGVCQPCTGATYSDAPGATECITCPKAKNTNDIVMYYQYYTQDGKHTARSGCQAVFQGKDIPGGSVTQYGCFIDENSDEYGISATGGTCWTVKYDLKCNAGYYQPEATETDSKYKQYHSSTLKRLWEVTCMPVGIGYWSASDTLTRTACPAGLSTIGYGAGADEVADCGRVLHIGDSELHLRSEKRTSPALHVKIDGATFYGDMSTARKGHLRIKIGDTVYSVYDDSM